MIFPLVQFISPEHTYVVYARLILFINCSKLQQIERTSLLNFRPQMFFPADHIDFSSGLLTFRSFILLVFTLFCDISI